jgi:hypothetical protein
MKLLPVKLSNGLPTMPSRFQTTGELAAALAAIALALGGCFEFDVPAPSTTVSPMSSVMRPAKAPDCPIQVLSTMPTADVQQLALLDTWGDQSTNDADLMPELKRKACEIGADAVVITSNKSQHEGDQLVGWDSGVNSTVAAKTANVSQRMHDPEVGEVGHGGHYLSGVAIAFVKGGPQTTSTAGQ